MPTRSSSSKYHCSSGHGSGDGDGHASCGNDVYLDDVCLGNVHHGENCVFHLLRLLPQLSLKLLQKIIHHQIFCNQKKMDINNYFYYL